MSSLVSLSQVSAALQRPAVWTAAALAGSQTLCQTLEVELADPTLQRLALGSVHAGCGLLAASLALCLELPCRAAQLALAAAQPPPDGKKLM